MLKASAQGLVPDLERLVTLNPEGFEVGKIEDQGVSVSKFDPESEEIAVNSGPRAKAPLTAGERRTLRAELQGLIQRLDELGGKLAG